MWKAARPNAATNAGAAHPRATAQADATASAKTANTIAGTICSGVAEYHRVADR